MSKGVLLDTCAAIWVVSGAPIADSARSAVLKAAQNDEVMVTPFTAWEMAMLEARGRAPIKVDPLTWYDALLKVPGIREIEVTAKLLVRSQQLPGEPPRNPMDRLMIATAREEGLFLVTRDRHILQYGGAGHVRVMAC